MTDLLELEKLARDHKPCPEFAKPADECYYWTMRNVYDGFRSKKLSADDAKKAKAQAARQHESFSLAYDKYMKAMTEWNDRIRKTDQLRAMLAKSKTVTEALLIAAEIIKESTGDVTVIPEVQRLCKKEND